MSELTHDELDAIKARLDGAKDGPWQMECGDSNTWHWEIFATDTAEEIAYCYSANDGFFIAHARTDIARLVAEVEWLQAENAALRARVVPNYSEQCPTKPGGYWMCKGGGGTPVLIELLHCSGELHVCHTDGMFYPLWKQFNDGWRFAGPIPEPKGGGDEGG